MDYTWTVNTPTGSWGNPPMSALAVGHGFFMLLFSLLSFVLVAVKFTLESLRQNNEIRKRRFKVHAIFQARSSSLASLVGSSVDSEAFKMDDRLFTYVA